MRGLMLIVLVWVSAATMFAIFKECGVRALLFGNGAFVAAVSGACER